VVTNTIPANGNCLAASASDTIVITPSANASFVYTSATYCTSGTTATPIITGVSGGHFSAVPVGLVIDPLTGTINLPASAVGVYALTYSVTGVCANSSTITMTITDTTPSALFTYSNSSFCQGGNNPYVVFSPGASAGVFSATPSGLVFEHINTGEINIGASAPGTYIVTNTILASGSCLAASGSTVIVINGAPVITATPMNQTICTGSSTAIALTSTIPGTDFHWTVNSNGVSGAGPSAGSTSAIAQTLTTNGNNIGVATYFVSGSSNTCTGDSVMVTVTVIPLPAANNIAMIITPANCSDSAGSILGLIVPSGQTPMTMIWQNASGDTVSVGSSDLVSAIPGSYTLTLKDTNGCSLVVGPFIVNATSGVTPAFTADPTTGQTPLTVNFTNASLNAVTYLWHFGDTDTSTQTNPTYVIIPSGDFHVCLTAYNTHGCFDTVCTNINVDQNSAFIVPNVFTPNGDGVNDLFSIQGTALKTMDAEIFNRWGQKEFEWHAPAGSWDGRTASGLLAPDGTYYYMIKAEGKDGKKYSEKGSFMLLREGK
jgi:gliding motility-associated-like protein